MYRVNKNRITTDSRIMTGKPIIAGTRITVELILRQLAQGIAVEEILQNYPHLTKADVLAAIQYALNLTQEEFVYPFKPYLHEKTKAVV